MIAHKIHKAGQKSSNTFVLNKYKGKLVKKVILWYGKSISKDWPALPSSKDDEVCPITEAINYLLLINMP
jgi:hypothetical protein